MHADALIDMVRGLHLLCFAAGMGVGLCFDLRTLRTLNAPVTRDDVWTLHQVHLWITAAFGGLWITGLALVYVRTGFALEAFTPMLWTKLGLMTLMVANAVAIARVVMPVMEASVGRMLTALPARRLAVVTQIAVTSLFCWTAGMALGSSVVLKTAGWDVLLPLVIGGYVAMTVGGQAMTWTARWRRAEDPLMRLRGMG